MDPEKNLLWFDSLSERGIKLGLERITELMSRLDNPQSDFRAVHVAGSDGKGSVCAMIESVLKESGFHTGMFTSPHILKINECIRIDGEPVSDADLIFVLSKIRSVSEDMEAEGVYCTQFEILAATAILMFSSVSCDIAIMETGMGGRYDCTSIINPDVTVINNISMEHTGFLGQTIEEIIFHKAGIMKPGIPCVTLNDKKITGILEKYSRETGCRLISVNEDDIRVVSCRPDSTEIMYRDSGFTVGLPGHTQARNAAVAVEALKCLPEFAETIEEHLFDGLRNVYWPCRMQKLMGMPVILDVTHTEAGALYLRRDIEEIYGKIILVIGLLSDKNIERIAEILSEAAEKVFVASPDSPRAAPAGDVFAAVSRYHGDVTLCGSVGEAIGKALEIRNDTDVLVTGSFRTAEDALKWIQNAYAKS